MKAVNLIPPDEARAGGAGRSGGGAYLLLAALALAVVMVSAYAYLGKTVSDKRAEVQRVREQADVAEAKAGSLKPYTDFAALRKGRSETVQTLALSRFDWAHAFREVARTIPPRTSLTSMRATIAPGIGVEGASDALRASRESPAIELAGCTTSQRDVARLLASMRRIDGVDDVRLSSASKPDTGATTGGGDCGQGKSGSPQFSMTVFFSAQAAPPGTPSPTGGAAASGDAAG